MPLLPQQTKQTTLDLLVNLGLAAFLFVSVFLVLQSLVSSQPFGWDESVYLTKARSWMSALPADQFMVYRPIGMAMVGRVLLTISQSETAVRIFGVIMGALTIAAIYLFFARIANKWIALGTASITATSSLFLKEAPQFYNDIPSSGLLILTLYFLYSYYQSEATNKAIYGAVISSAFAFYIRYGVVSTLAIIAILTFWLLGASFSFSKKNNNQILKKAVLIAVLLFAPHIIYSTISTRSPLGILTASGSAAGREYLGQGLLDYIQWLPHDLGGWALGIGAIAGILMTIFFFVYRKYLPPHYLNLLWIGSIGLASFAVTGILVHAEARYVFFPSILLSGVGMASIYFIIENRSKLAAKLAVVIVMAGSLFLGTSHFNETQAFFKDREENATTIAYLEALNAIERDKGGKLCAAWLVLFRPTASWYSGCNIMQIKDVASFERDIRANPGKIYYSLVFSKLTEPQITPSKAAEYGVVMDEVFRINGTARGDLVVYRMNKTLFKTLDPSLPPEQAKVFDGENFTF